VSSDADINPSNNTSGPVKITVNCAADVQVSKTTTTPIITAGNQATFGIGQRARHRGLDVRHHAGRRVQDFPAGPHMQVG
jgi:hypothetical protein